MWQDKEIFFHGRELGEERIGVLKNKLDKFHDLFDLVLIFVANMGAIATVKVQTLNIGVLYWWHLNVAQ